MTYRGLVKAHVDSAVSIGADPICKHNGPTGRKGSELNILLGPQRGNAMCCT